MKKSVKCTVLCLIMVCCMFFSLPLTVFAVDNYQININEPAKGTNQGYILLLCEYDSGSRFVQCLMWSILPVYANSSVTPTATEMMIDISNSSGKVIFSARSNDNFQISVGMGRSFSGASTRSQYWSMYENSTGLQYVYSLGNYSIIGYQLYGNAVLESEDVTTNNAFSVSWGDDAYISSNLIELLAFSAEMVANDEEALQLYNDILIEMNDQGITLDNINLYITRIHQLLVGINQNVNNIEYYSRIIMELLQGSGESTFEEPSTESISDYNKAEDELVSGADDTSDIEAEIGKVEINENASGLIWSIIQGFYNQNPKVFGLVIAVLAIGIIALILNR